jgi:hypothetical protein
MDGELCDRGKVSDVATQECKDLDGELVSFCFGEPGFQRFGVFWKMHWISVDLGGSHK